MGLKHSLNTWAGAMLADYKAKPDTYLLKQILLRDGTFEIDWWDKTSREIGYIVTFDTAYARDDLVRLCADLKVEVKPLVAYEKTYSIIIKHRDSFPDVRGMDQYGYPIIAPQQQQ